MKLKTKYIIMAVACIVMCSVIVIVNYVEYMNSKELVVKDLYNSERTVYAALNEVLSDTDKQETININTATAQELADFLPNIGKTKAENIVAYREAIGGFKSVEELIEVSGIGESTLNVIRDYCRVSDD